MQFGTVIEEEYFKWLYDYVGKSRGLVSYEKLFMMLYDIEFTFTLTRDVNRAKDGINLRNRYAKEVGDYAILDVLEDKPCSVLEMILALAIRCEETIMDDPRYGDRTSQWFWSMINNLGIDYLTDDRFNPTIASDVIYRFVNREYEPDGQGGLFYIRDCIDDLRRVEIWTQLCWYLDYGKFA